MILHVLIAMVAGWLQRHQQQVITYLIEENPYSQKTQTQHNHGIYGLTVTRSSSCNPLLYSPYSLPLRDNERLWWYDLWTGSTY